jgi:chloramphenicol 3-O phosphotransferase
VLLVGVRCPIEEIMRRRDAGEAGREGGYATSLADGSVPEPVLRWQHEVHQPGIYDLEVDTAALSPAECAEAIRRRLVDGPQPTALRQISMLKQPGGDVS